MKFRTNRIGKLIILFALSIAWLILPHEVRRAIQPTALAAATTFTVNVTGDGQDANPGDGICQTNVAGNCSLRAAIGEANANSGKDTINFNIPGAGVHTISPNTPLPAITQGVIIDGYSQPGASPNTLPSSDNAVLLIELSGANIAPDPNGGENGLEILDGNGTTIQGLVVNSFVTVGIGVESGAGRSSETTIQGNFIGTDPTGNLARPNRVDGVFLSGSLGVQSNNRVGGSTPAARNVISGNGDGQAPLLPADGIFIEGGGPTFVENNFVGLNAAGTAALPNEGDGVHATFSIGAIIGGSVAARNIISGNGGNGIFFGGGNEGHNLVQQNFIGTNPDGTAAIPNARAGVQLNGLTDVIGSPNAGNLISGNGEHGVFIDGGESNQVQGNYIGTDLTGTTPLGNTLSGVSLADSANGNTIGGAIGLGNTIAFNGDRGVNVTGADTISNAILTNSMFSNGNLGIDLGGAGVTQNDPADGDAGPNNLQNFPVLNSAITSSATTIVNGSIDGTPNTAITVQFFTNATCDPSGNGEGQTFVGSINKMTGADGHFMFSSTMMTNVAAGQFITTTATDSGNNTSEFSQCVQVTGSSSSKLQLGQSFYSVFEDCTALTITVARTGDTANAASVDYASQPGTASDHSDFNTAVGTLNFAPGETAKSFDVLITEDSFVEPTESFTVALSNSSGATLGSPATATVQIFDDSPESSGNPIDAADDFVCQHYHDFLNREDDSAGLDFWANQIEACGNDVQCREAKRVSVSAAFFLSIEFQETGGFAIRVQRAAFGKKSDDATKRLNYLEFIHDARFVGDGVVVGQPGFAAHLEANKQAYINQIVASAAFTSGYPTTMTAAQYVDALFSSAAVTPTASDRQAAINAFAGGGTAGRGAALRSVSDSNSLRTAEFSPSFVLMQYFGYLRRNPTDAPDNNDNGYQFWLTKLNNFNGDFQKAEMVKAFILSGEYRSRFGTP
ncbi:MAG TPA: Calx-beta domain-containing protein [Pyrinomonadaceae bacterium]|nr:Calx-beta domain-containing protein [Pyrinomonadaceae bacterium]